MYIIVQFVVERNQNGADWCFFVGSIFFWQRHTNKRVSLKQIKMEQIIYESQELELKNDDHILNHAHRSFQPIYDGEKRKDKEISRK